MTTPQPDPAGPAPRSGPATAPVGEGASARRYLVETWGCQMNGYDSERLAGQLAELGYRPASGEEQADLIVLNTCSVREKAAEKLFSRLGRLRELKRRRPGLLVGVAGCVAQQEREQVLRRAPVVDFVLGPRAVASLRRLLARAEAGERAIDVTQPDERYDEVQRIERAGTLRAWVTVIEGCNKACSFCVVPFTRGREVNRPPAAVLEEVARAVAAGAVEVELLGQNVNAYRHGATDFADLLRLVDRVAGVKRLRFATSHPRELSERVIAAMAEGEHVCRHLHLPVQSGSNRTLKHMYRGYDRDRYLDRIARLRARMPDIALSTDVIVGFPGETRADFEETLTLLAEVRFDQVFAFVYSPRPNTAARDLDDPVPKPVKETWLLELFAVQDDISRQRNATLVGRRVEVLAEGPSKRNPQLLTGRTGDNRVVNFAAPADRVGRFLPVRITRALAHSLIGELADDRAGGD